MSFKHAKKILIVEDESFLSKTCSFKLKKEGYDVTIASDGEEAVRLAQEIKPDLVLLDLVLPKLNGFDVLDRIRATAANKHTPVIVLSNLGQAEDIKRAEALGADGYLLKADHSLDDVLKKVNDRLGGP